jgi:undecaprenyl-phosphate galactose phosphotransferase
VVNSRLVLLLFFPIALGFLVLERFVVLRGILKFLAKHEIYQRRLIILGAGRVGRLLAANLSLDNPYGIKILGYLDDTIPQGTPIFRGLRVLGKIADLTRIASELKADEIVLSVENVNSEELFQLLELSTQTGATVKIASPLYDIIESFRFTERYGEIPVVGLSQRINGTLAGFSKRLFDFVLAGVGIVVLSPVFLAIAAAIKLDSRGSVFYRQTRVGKNGKVFDFYKFRSMLVGSDQDETRKHKVARLIRGEVADGITDTKIVDESKITRVGKFIRKTSLDELPQLMNVLIGDMSLVGPRPCLPYEWEHYEEWQKKRLSAMPGCTGVWQVSGRNTISFDDMVIMDFYYIQNSSLLLDLQLILKTIPVMVFGRGGK